METKLKSYIVDDQKASVERLQYLLTKCADVVVVGSSSTPVEALDEIVEIQPDVVFLDIEMPHLSGFELIEKVRAKHVFPKFVFITGYSQYAIKAIKSRAFDYLLKPVDLDELKKAVNRLCPEKEMEQLYSNLDLSRRERQIVEMLLKGYTSQKIADELYISKNTVNTHRRNLLERNHFRNTRELLVYFNINHS